jgi:hypothetical protein
MAPVETLKELPTPQDFYERYVKERRPVVLQGCCSALAPKLLSGVQDLDKLGKLVVGDDDDADDVTVEVNELLSTTNNDSSSFSPKHSQVVHTPFMEFLQNLQQGSTRQYMTTQSLPADDEGRPALFTTPVTQLVHQNMVELRPVLLGHLMPMTYNLWMGRTQSHQKPTSSGLHHDFHDNLYCLLQGSKTFKIAPPSAIHKLKMKGTLCRLHENGRVVYQEQLADGMVRPDGALEQVERLVELEMRREEIEAKLQKNDAKEKEKLEQELDEIEEELLQIEVGTQPEDESGGSDDEEGDVLFSSRKGGQDSDESDEEEDVGLFSSHKGGINNSASDEDDDSDQAETRPVKRSKLDGDTNDVPVNFVVNTDTAGVQFETVKLEKGDLFYLPAGWFHEVFSDGGDKGGIHSAFNYWMHPPDTTDGVCFEHPYISAFWPRDWEARNLT